MTEATQQQQHLIRKTVEISWIGLQKQNGMEVYFCIRDIRGFQVLQISQKGTGMKLVFQKDKLNNGAQDELEEEGNRIWDAMWRLFQ